MTVEINSSITMGAPPNESAGDSSSSPHWKEAIRLKCTSKQCWNFFIYSSIGIVALTVVFASTYAWDASLTPRYSATITAVSGLDPATDLQQQQQSRRPGTLSPAFNLTFVVASHSRREGACIPPGTSVKVSYSHPSLPMATGRVPETCVGPRESRALPPVVASGRDVDVPGFLMDSLAAEMSSGEAMFEVKLSKSDEFGWWGVAEAWGRIGDTFPLYRY